MSINSTSKFENETYINEYTEKIEKGKSDTASEIERINDVLNEDFGDIDQTDLVGETNKSIRLYNKYSMMFFEKRNVYINLEKNRDKLESELLNYFKFDYDKSTKMTDGLADKFIKGFPLYANLLELVKSYKNYLDLIERAIDICKTRGFAIKNIIEWKKIEFGMN